MTEGEERDDLGRAREEALAAIDWRKTLKRMIRSALWQGVPPAAAQDVVQDAIARMVRLRGMGWNFQGDPNASRYLLRKMTRRIEAIRELQERREKLQPIDVNSDVVDATPPDSDRGAEGELVTGEAAVRNLDRLRTSLANSPLALALLEHCVLHGQRAPRELALALGVPVEEIYIAEAMLRRHARRLRADGSDPELKRSVSFEGSP